MLDGVDTLAILRTGMGKTGFLSMYMLVLLEILKHPHLCPSVVAKFPEKPLSFTFCTANDERAGQTGFISVNGILVEYMRSESRSRQLSL